MARIYLSSTYGDLQEYRQAVYKALRQMQHDVAAMEDYVAADQRPLAKCLADVAGCDIYVGIFAWRYGYVPTADNPADQSITEREYRQAAELGKPTLLFLLDEGVPWPRPWQDDVTGDGERGARIKTLRAELGQEKLVSFFKSAEELAGLVATAVHNLETEWRKKAASAGNGDSLPATPLTINRQEAIVLFDRLVQPDSPHRALHLLGDAQMGKTHLMSQIFPQRASDLHRLLCTTLSLHSQTNVADILYNLVSRLAEAGPFVNFERAYQQWVTRPVHEARDNQELFAQINTSAQKTEDEGRKFEPMLTTQFVADLRLLANRPLLLLFDALDNAPEPIRAWLFHTLLGHLATLPHMRVVVAGRNLPDPTGDYAASCRVYRLQPVRDETEYINYCRQVKAALVEQSIRDFARAVDYRPGQFVGLVEAFREM